jgi:hypothetical protein
VRDADAQPLVLRNNSTGVDCMGSKRFNYPHARAADALATSPRAGVGLDTGLVVGYSGLDASPSTSLWVLLICVWLVALGTWAATGPASRQFRDEHPTRRASTAWPHSAIKGIGTAAGASVIVPVVCGASASVVVFWLLAIFPVAYLVSVFLVLVSLTAGYLRHRSG